MNSLQDYAKAIGGIQQQTNVAGTEQCCPNCGRCPTCGRGGYQTYPYWYYPYYPSYPNYTMPSYTVPYQITCSNTGENNG